MGSYWKILSRKVIQVDLCFHKLFQNSSARWCGPEGCLREPNGPCTLQTCLLAWTWCQETDVRLRSFPQQTSHQVCRSHRWNTAMGTPSPPKGAFSLHLIPLQETPPLLPSLQFTLMPPPLCKPPVQLPSERASGVSCWGLSDTGADLVNRKLSAKQGRWSWRLRAPWARWAAHGVNGPGSGVSTHFPMGFNFQSNVILGERGVQITQGTLLLAGDYIGVK